MCISLLIGQESSWGYMVRKLRISNLLTQQELAAMAGVSQKEVKLLEHNMPLRLEAKRRILQELWAMKANKR